MNKKIGALFPGQGSQSVGMIKVLFEQFPETKKYFEEASDALNLNLGRLCLEGPEETLALTQNAQPAILVTSYSWFKVAEDRIGLTPIAGAGHSLGEYSALLCSGAFSLSEGASIVQKRGMLMQEAVPVGKGKMAAVLGLEDAKVIALCEKASQGSHSIVVPANFNAPSQVVIAGHSEAVDRAEGLASGNNYPDLKAKKFIPLKVSAPFHSPLMKPVCDQFVPYLEKLKWKDRKFPITHNLDAVSRSKGDLIGILRDQIDHSVLWVKCQQVLNSIGIDFYVEMGPGRVLSGLGKRIVDGAKFFPLESEKDLQALEKESK